MYTNNNIHSTENSTPIFIPLPPEVRFPNGTSDGACPVFDELCDFLRKWSPRSFEGYYEGVALFILSTIAARRVSFDLGKRRYTNLQIMLVGRTGISAKSTVASIATDILKAAGLGDLLIPDLITPQKLVNLMASNLEEEFNKLSDEEKQAVQ